MKYFNINISKISHPKFPYRLFASFRNLLQLILPQLDLSYNLPEISNAKFSNTLLNALRANMNIACTLFSRFTQNNRPLILLQ